MEWFLSYDKICVEKLALVKIRKNKPKSETSLSQLQNIINIQNLSLDYCFVDDKCNAISLHITKDVKIQDGRQLWLKNRFRY